MNRRHFLKVAGLGLLGVAIAPFIKLPEDNTEAMPKEVVKKVEAPELPTDIIPDTYNEYDMGSTGDYYWTEITTSGAANNTDGYNSSITVSNVW